MKIPKDILFKLLTSLVQHYVIERNSEYIIESLRDSTTIGFAFDYVSDPEEEYFNFISKGSITVESDSDLIWIDGADGYSIRIFQDEMSDYVGIAEAKHIYKRGSEEWKLLEKIVEASII